MTSQKKLFLAALCLAVVVTGFVVNRPPDMPPACVDAQEAMLQAVLNDNGLAAGVGQVDDSFIKSAIVKRCAALTAAQCSDLTASLSSGTEALAHTTWAAGMLQAARDVRHAMHDCHDKRVAGEIKTHAQSAECSNGLIAEAYKKAGYPYSDLVEQFTAKRLALAQALDKDNPGGAEDPAEFAALALSISDEERSRVTKAH